MHMPDGVLDPVTLSVAGAASAGAIAWSVRELRRGDARWGLAVGGAGIVLLAHLADMPLYGPYTAHLIGGTLLAVALGPWLAMLTMAAVLALEAVGWGEGGVSALGVNVLVMGVVGVLAGYGVYRGALAVLAGWRGADAGAPTSWWRVPASALGAWASVMASALTLTVVSIVGGGAGLVLGEVVAPHAAWGAMEAAVTSALVAIGVAWSRAAHVRAARAEALTEAESALDGTAAQVW
ncbi:energy-coupling factor ABC transporter permease [Demequina capsici]|uniref:Energy-coupling factor ABC transporter permease n=1 Tax=Demequina capsici TaxID=3075620 RepID=A0AA96F404_9MICO|nr:energy-coupling factor ABC transporter permease [Demequina sp. OYTSA14]WNM23497.1 energy-coupling factor ABC transporter permease [Demequina sp. OYTSA14]